MTQLISDGPSDDGIDDPPESARGREALILAIARLKLRLEVCLRRDRDNGTYKATLATCLDDVDNIVRAASAVSSRSRGRT